MRFKRNLLAAVAASVCGLASAQNIIQGAGASNTSTDGIAIGNGASVVATPDNAPDIVIGASATSTGSRITYGPTGLAISGGANAVVGAGATALNSTGGTVFGSGASVRSTDGSEISAGTAIGIGARSVGNGGTAVGATSYAGTVAVAVGPSASASAEGSIAIGGCTGTVCTSDPITGAFSAVPAPTGRYSISIGANAQSAGKDSIALGASASASHFNSVALGATTQTSRDNTVAVGGRQITDVAAGVAGTDAVNVNQLNQGVASAVAQANAYTNQQLRNGTVNANFATVTTGGLTINPSSNIDMGGNAVHNIGGAGGAGGATGTDVAGGQLSATSTDAVNGSQLFSTNQAVAALDTRVNTAGTSVANNFGGGSTYNPTTGVVSAPSYTVNGGTYKDVGSAIGAIGGTITENNTGNRPAASATGANSVAIGAGSNATRDNSVDFGGRQLTGIAPGTQDTDAGTVGQLRQATADSKGYTDGQIRQATADSKGYTDRAIASLDAKSQKMISAVGAMAMAAAALQPNARAEGAWSISAAAATYGGEGAIAAGINYQVSNQVLVNARIGLTSNGPSKTGAAIGVSWGF
jgi:trimeric autotransporter adhesin